MPGFPVHHQLLEFAQTHVHRVGDAIQPSHPLSSPSPPGSMFPSIRAFPVSQFFTSGDQKINNRRISVHFQGKPFNITVIQVYAPTSNTEEAEVEWFCENLQDLLELTPNKDVLFIIGDWTGLQK